MKEEGVKKIICVVATQIIFFIIVVYGNLLHFLKYNIY